MATLEQFMLEEELESHRYEYETDEEFERAINRFVTQTGSFTVEFCRCHINGAICSIHDAN